MALRIDHQITLKIIHGDENEILKLLRELKILNIENMAKTKQDFDALNERLSASHTAISESLTNLADDVRRLTEGMTPTGGLTEEEATEVFAGIEDKANKIEDAATKIKALADQTPEPPAPEA